MIAADHITEADEHGRRWWVPQPGRSSFAMLRDRPCDNPMCNTGWLNSGGWNPIPDPDCSGTGRHCFDIGVGDHKRPPSMSLDAAGEAPCDSCVRTLRVHVAPYMVLPIYGESPADWPDMLTADKPCIVIKDDGTAVLWDGAGDFADVTLPPAAKPGMWAVQLQEV